MSTWTKDDELYVVIRRVRRYVANTIYRSQELSLGLKLLTLETENKKDVVIKSQGYEWEVHGEWVARHSTFLTKVCLISRRISCQPLTLEKLVEDCVLITIDDTIELIILDNINPFILDLTIEFLYTRHVNVKGRWKKGLEFCSKNPTPKLTGDDYFDTITEVYFFLARARVKHWIVLNSKTLHGVTSSSQSMSQEKIST